MAKYQTYFGALRSPASTGSQAYTGVGFQPKALLIWSANTALTPPEFNHFNYWSFGMTDGTNHMAQTSISFDNNATTDCNQGIATNRVILSENTAGTGQHQATFTSFDSDGFTLNWTTIFSSEERYYIYLAIGGDEVECEVGEFNSDTATGSQVFAGLSFKPTSVIFAPVQNAGTSEDRLTYPAIGWTDGTNQGCSYVFSENGAAATNSKRYQRINKCMALGSASDGSVLAEAEITEFTDTGFEVNWTTAPASALRIFYLAVTGIPFACGSLTQPAASQREAVEGVGFTPGAVLLQSVNAAASTSVQDENDFSLGGASTVQTRAMWMADKDGADPVQASRYYSESLAYAAGVVAATASTLACSATLASMDYDGFTLSHTADGTQRQILWAAFSSEQSHRNRVSGYGHEVYGHDNVVSGRNNVVIGNNNVIHGSNGTIKGERSILFNLDGVTRTLEADDTFEVYGEIGGDLSSGGSPGGSPSGSSDYVFIEEQTPSGTGTLTFSSLGSYRHLKILFAGRGTQAANATVFNMGFNGDTSAIYDRQNINANATTVNAAESLAQTAIAQVGVVSASSATAGACGAGEITIFDYRGTTFWKRVTSVYSWHETTASGGNFIRSMGGGWRSTAAITSITITLGSGNFEAGTTFSLYGIA